MSWIHDTLADFGRRIGIDHLQLGHHGAAQLQFEGGDLLAVEPTTRAGIAEVLVYMTRLAGHEASARIHPALRLANAAHRGPFPLQVALRGSGVDTRLLALVRVDERAFTPQALAQAVDFLTRWLDQAMAERR